MELYAKALTVNPANASAAASAVRLRTRTGLLEPQEGLAQISELARAHPQNNNVIAEATNLFQDLREYGGMLELIDELRQSHPTNGPLWRNRAVALERLGHPDEQIDEAFHESVELARRAGNAHAVTDAARPYVHFLLQRRAFDKARQVLREALAGDPESAQLLTQYGDLERASGNPDNAQWCYERAASVASSFTDRANAERHLKTLRAALTLHKRGILPSQEPPAAATLTLADDDGNGEPVGSSAAEHVMTVLDAEVTGTGAVAE